MTPPPTAPRSEPDHCATTPGADLAGPPSAGTAAEVAGSVTELVVAPGGGAWVIGSESPTRYILDLGLNAMGLLRQAGERSTRGPYDGTWVALLSVSSAEDVNVIRVGRRHRYDLDPGGAVTTWWLQRVVTSIRPVAPEDLPVGRVAAPDEDSRPFTRAAAPGHSGQSGSVTAEEPKEQEVSALDLLITRIEARPGAAERIEAAVSQMNEVLEPDEPAKTACRSSGSSTQGT